MLNIKETIMSQYANSPKILTLISGINDAIDPQYFVDDFYEYVYRLSTAKGFGLDIWADRVGVSRNAPIADANSVTFGFETEPTQDEHFTPFNVAPFSDGGSFSSYRLPDDILRRIIIIKAASNILYATAININKFLKLIFGSEKRAYYNITGHMTAEYVLEFKPDVIESLIIYTFSMLPKPSGVGISYREIDMTGIFGFNGSGLNTFNNGVFFNGY